MWNFVGILKFIGKFLATPAGIIVIAFIVIQAQSGRINKLKEDNRELNNRIKFEETVNNALLDTIKFLGDHKPLPKSIRIEVPVPINIPVPRFESDDTDSIDTPFVTFYDKFQWEEWYRDHCTGIIELDTTQIWGNGMGARAQGQFYYGIGVNRRNWLLITPAGNWSIKPKREGFRGGIEWLVNADGDISIGADITWRKWGPTIKFDINEFSNIEGWLGVRRSF